MENLWIQKCDGVEFPVDVGNMFFEGMYKMECVEF